MSSARDLLKKFVGKMKFNHASIPIVGNLTGRATRDAKEIGTNIVEQLVHPVRWSDCVEFMVGKGVDTFFEMGPSKILRGLIKSIAPRMKIMNLEKKKDFDNLDGFLSS